MDFLCRENARRKHNQIHVKSQITSANNGQNSQKTLFTSNWNSFLLSSLIKCFKSPKDIYIVSVMPCNAKKLEATRGNFTRKVHMKDD
jgi:hypothetical protein